MSDYDLINPNNEDFYQAVLEAVGAVLDSAPPNRLYFFTSGTGIPDAVAIEYWKDSGVVVVDTNWQKWLRGEKIGI